MVEATLSTSEGQSCPSRNPASTRAHQRPRNERLQHLRGLGAVLVLLYHVSFYLDQFRGDGRFLTYFSGFLGVYGVAIFFVLSGYLMAAVSMNGSAARFVLDRVVRIYPLLFIVVGLTSVGLWLTGFPRRPDPVALLLAPSGPRDFMLGVEWTLLFEMTYYVVIGIAMALGLRRLLSWIFGAWLSWLAVATLLNLSPEQTLTPTLVTLFGQSANASFLLGFLTYGYITKSAQTRFLPGALAASAIAIALSAPFTPEAAHRWTAAVSGALLVAAALRAAPAAQRWGTEVARKLGDASYALYLVHVPVILLSQHVISDTIPPSAVFVLWVLGSTALALLLTPLDLALHKRLKVWVGAARPKSVTAVALAFIVIFLGVAIYQQYKVSTATAAADRARLALLNSSPTANSPTLMAEIDSAAVLPDGRLIARGFAIDPSSPDDGSHIALFQGERIVAFDRMTRMRPSVAEAHNRLDLVKVRFGFAVVTSKALDCAQGTLSAKVVLSTGIVVPIEGGALATLCK